MKQLEIVLTVGESVVVGNRVYTVLDVEGDEATFRVESTLVDDADDAESEPAYPAQRAPARPR